MEKLESVSLALHDIEDVDREGVYLFFFRNGQSLLDRSGYSAYDPAPLIVMDGAPLCYVGSSMHVRKRMRAHLRGDSRQSNLRITVASILADDLGLKGWSSGPSKACHFGIIGEKVLTEWFLDHSVVRFIGTSQSRELEMGLIAGLRPPFNISSRRTDSYAKHFMRLRSRFGYFADLPFGTLRSWSLH